MRDNRTRVCPVCGRHYNDKPAISRADNKTAICPTCGLREALLIWKVSQLKALGADEQLCRTIRGQINHGDLDGAEKGIRRITKRQEANV